LVPKKKKKCAYNKINMEKTKVVYSNV
jgi:hypothetical protein